jgi:hypothetical protein
LSVGRKEWTSFATRKFNKQTYLQIAHSYQPQSSMLFHSGASASSLPLMCMSPPFTTLTTHVQYLQCAQYLPSTKAVCNIWSRQQWSICTQPSSSQDFPLVFLHHLSLHFFAPPVPVILSTKLTTMASSSAIANTVGPKRSSNPPCPLMRMLFARQWKVMSA